MRDINRFMANVDMSGGPDACHEWTGERSNGYGLFVVEDGLRTYGAHRWILGFQRGEHLRPKELACHHCDNPPCVNVAHLYVGDAKTNYWDAVNRGLIDVTRPGEFQKEKTHCPKGHPYSGSNLAIDHRGRRKCRRCARIRRHEAYKRKKARAARRGWAGPNWRSRTDTG